MLHIAFKKSFCHSLPDGHRFPMLKYELIPKQLLLEGIAEESQFFEPEELDLDILLRTHTSDYYNSLKNQTISARAMRKIGFPPSPELLKRELEISQGTLLCAIKALDSGVAMNVAGGTHHAYANSGEGFCIFNDFAIASNELIHRQLVKEVLIIDLDVHQGNGTAKLMEKKNQVFTFSMHGKDNYPMYKEKSDWDIELKTGTKGEEYLSLLEDALKWFEKNSKAEFLFYQCGVDVLETDKLGKLALSKEDCALRDEMVFDFAKRRGLPLVAAMGGGYSPRIADILDAHVNTFRLASNILT